MRPLVYFYAPLKSPLHATPSGDRTLARLWIEAWEKAGATVYLASQHRTYEGRGDAERQQQLQQTSVQESERLLTQIAAGIIPRPSHWFTYHLYYKAPDALGAIVSRALKIPYFVAEASIRPPHQCTAWQAGAQSVLESVQHADAILTLNPKDAAGIIPCLKKGAQHYQIPAFLSIPHQVRNSDIIVRPLPLRVLTIAMMREGAKYQSYEMLAETLALLPAQTLELHIVGDGVCRPQVESLFQKCPQKVVFHGLCEGEEMENHYKQADLFLWPAIREALGMVLLEAQARGVPVLCGHTAGTASLVNHGITGWVIKDVSAFLLAQHLKTLTTHPEMLFNAGKAAYSYVQQHHSVETVLPLLQDLLTYG